MKIRIENFVRVRFAKICKKRILSVVEDAEEKRTKLRTWLV